MLDVACCHACLRANARRSEATAGEFEPCWSLDFELHRFVYIYLYIFIFSVFIGNIRKLDPQSGINWEAKDVKESASECSDPCRAFGCLSMTERSICVGLAEMARTELSFLPARF